MILSNSQLIPEFQYYFNRFATTSIVNKYEIPIPVEVPEQFIPHGTVVELLCNDEYPYDSYTYLYKNETSIQCWPTLTRQRLMVYPGSQYMVPTSDPAEGTNIFNLQTDDFLMLDALLAYRHDSTSVVMIDSTSIQVITDATSGITYVYASVNALNTSLSKEIYVYLQFKIYTNYELYNTTTILSDCTLLATCFELKMIDDYFQFMTNRGIGFDIDCAT